MQLEGLQIGSYRLLRLIGGGGMGDVYLAEDLRINRQVAIKVIQTRNTSFSNVNNARSAIRFFQREMKAIANLDHPHILPFFDCGSGNIQGMDITYMVMPFRREGSLVAWLRQHSPSRALPPPFVAHFVRQAADALQYAHDQHIIHRDVKPSNFLIRSNKDDPGCPDLLLADFGLAKFSTMTSTVSGTNYGTPIYMAPEHWDGKPVPATDQYALAVMAYELLTGRPPFTGNQQQVMYQHLEMQPQPPSKFNPAIPASTDAVILRALSKRPEHRYLSIAAFAEAFEQSLQPATGADTRRTTQELQNSSNGGYTFQTWQSSKSPGTPSSSKKNVRVSAPSPASISGNSIRGETLARRESSSAAVLLALAVLLIVLAVGGAVYVGMNMSHTAPIPTTGPSTPSVTGITPLATALPPQEQNPYGAHQGKLVFYDPLYNNGRGFNWDEVTDSNGSCSFTGTAYQVTTLVQGAIRPCTAANTFTNFAYQVQMTILAGDYGGILFRMNSTHKKFYVFRIGRDGSYEVGVVGGDQGTIRVLASGTSPAIKTGLNVPNIIAVVASGGNLDVYVNGQHLAHASDGSYSQGQIGVFAESSGSSASEVLFNSVAVWSS